MIASGDRTVLVSSMGWVDHDALWVFDVPREKEMPVPLASGAGYLSVHCRNPSHFAVAHHFGGSRFEVTVHEFAQPGRAVARGVFAADGSSLDGDPALWGLVPRLYIAYIGFPPWRDFVLLRVAAAESRIEAQRLEWYDESYDQMYQGIVAVVEIPGREVAVVSVQRSSRLVLHDLATGRSTGGVELAGSGGNPDVRLRRDGAELWASDYDSLVVVDPVNWKVLRSRRIQGAAWGTQQFVGEYAFDRDEKLCVVARPFAADVVGVDARTLRIVSRAKVGGQPLQVAVVGGDQVVARDWKTGTLLRGRLERRWFPW